MAPARGLCERAVEPHGVAAADEITAGEIAGRQVVVTGHGDEGPSEPPGHALDERVFPQPVGPLSMTGSRRTWHFSKTAISSAVAR